MWGNGTVMAWGEWPEQSETAGRRRRACPPHGPLLVEAAEEGTFATKCLVCGMWGPKREDCLQAKLAFDVALDAIRE
jgi:hypothetical protein